MKRYHIAVDSGKRTTKVVTEIPGANAHTRFSFATGIEEGITYTEDSNSHIVTYEGKTYLVGEQAYYGMDTDNSKDTIVHKICIMTAVALSVENNSKAVVVIGCPLEIYYDIDVRKAYRDNMLPEGKHTVIVDGKTISFEIEKAYVRPESYGIINLNADDIVDFTVNAVDIGGLNVNAAIYRSGKLDESSKITLVNGGIMLAQSSLNALKARSDGSIRGAIEKLSAESIEEYVINGVHQNIPNSAEILKQVRLKFVRDIKRELDKKKFDLINNTYFCGGTSYVLRDEIAECFGERGILAADDYESMKFVNAEGFYKSIEEV